MGRRRKRRSNDHQGHVEYFYPVTPSIKQPIQKRRNNSRILDDSKDIHAATNINDNVGVTVVMPEGRPSTYSLNFSFQISKTLHLFLKSLEIRF